MTSTTTSGNGSGRPGVTLIMVLYKKGQCCCNKSGKCLKLSISLLVTKLPTVKFICQTFWHIWLEVSINFHQCLFWNCMRIQTSTNSQNWRLDVCLVFLFLSDLKNKDWRLILWGHIDVSTKFYIWCFSGGFFVSNLNRKDWMLLL